jgi:purine-binding chemotaxis protein CheW
MTSRYLVFLLTGKLFGVRLTGALEILPWRRSRVVPLSYDHVEGLIDYRGTIYPVFNLERRLGMSKTEPIGFTARDESTTTGQSIILLEDNKIHFGIIVDTVAKMANLDDPLSVPEKAPGIDSRYVKGTVFEDDQEITILDFERLIHAG